MSFKDYFSADARRYARARPDYPAALFVWLQAQCRQHGLAWDCGTGNGQAACGLAPYFTQVIASDASVAQIAVARGPENVRFCVFPAEAPALAPGSADLITAAQCLHWFDCNRFFAAAQSLLAPAGVLAVWAYGLCRIEPDIDKLIGQLYEETLGPYWAPERSLVERGYAAIPFPFSRIASPDFTMEKSWSRAQLLDYLASWSATRHYVRKERSDPLVPLAAALEPLWPGGLEKKVSWPLSLHVGRK